MKQRDWKNPLEQPQSAAQADAAMYGAVDLPASGRIVAKPIDIAAIRPDVRQPRRAIPAVVRGQWDGAPNELPGVLATWHTMVEERLNREIAIEKVLRASDALLEEEFGDPIVDDYLALLKLAASIERDGLINPIRVGRDGGYVIESGERRWLAYNLLAIYVSRDYQRIPAIERDRVDPWAQAAENGARKPLNAIGLARQLALLIMDMYEGDRGVKFDRYEDLVLPGECDRRFYAQVKDGTLYPVKRGMGQRISHVTGLSASAIRQHRALLAIPDALWQKADQQNWSEFAIREYLAQSKPDISEPRSVTHVTLHEKNVDPNAHESDAAQAINEQRSVTHVTLHEKNVDPNAHEGERPRTRIGERLGLYDSPSVAAAEPIKTTTDTTCLYGHDRSAKSGLSTKLIDQMEQKEVLIAVLKVIQQYANAKQDKVTANRVRELLTISEPDIEQFISLSRQSGFFETHLRGTEKVVSRTWQDLGVLIANYFLMLSKVGERLENEL